MIHHHDRQEGRNVADSRLSLVAEDLWQRIAAADEATQRRVTATMVRLAMDAAPVSNGREQVEAALAAGGYGDSELRTWLKATGDAADVAAYEAAELDGNRDEAKRLARQHVGYKAAYLALDADAARAAGEVAYEAMVLVGQASIVEVLHSAQI
jgi:hypothetical protein